MKWEQTDLFQGLWCKTGRGGDFLVVEAVDYKVWSPWPGSGESRQEETSQEATKIKPFEEDPRMHLTLSAYRLFYPPCRTQHTVIVSVAGAAGEQIRLNYNTPPSEVESCHCAASPSSCDLCGDIQLIWAVGVRVEQMCRFRDDAVASHIFHILPCPLILFIF